MSQAVARQDVSNRTEIDAVVLTLSGGRSKDLAKIVSAIGSDEAVRESVRLATVRAIGTEKMAGRAIAVGIYALKESGAYAKSADIAEALGVSEGYVSQRVFQGRVLAELGMPEGWQTRTRFEDLQKLQKSQAAKVRDVLTDGGNVTTKRRALGQAVAEFVANKSQAEAQAQAARKATAEAKKGQAPEVSQAPASEDVTDERIAQAVSDFVTSTGVLMGSWDRLTTEQQQTIAATLAEVSKRGE